MTAGAYKIGRLILRRERFGSLLWLLGIVGVTLFFAVIFRDLFPDAASLSGMAAALDTPAMTAMMGPVYGMDALTPAKVLAAQMRIWMMLAAALLSIFLVSRHTRGDEELGRLEMLRSLPVGKLANAVSAFLYAAALQAAIALVSALGLLLVNVPGTTAAGAFSYACSIAAVGVVFAGIALLIAQLFSTPRGALAGSFAALGLAYALRASGDVSGNALSAVSPLGLVLRVESFSGDHAAPILFLLLEGLAFFLLALLCSLRRDLGEGVLPARRGKGRAARWMLSPLGFAFRLTRSQIVLWMIALFLIGAMYGSVMGDIEYFTASNDTYRQMLEATGAQYGLAESFVAMLFGIYAAISVLPVMLHALKPRAEEKRGRLDQLAAASVPRYAMLGSFAAVAVLESALMQLMAALGFYAAAAADSPVSFGVVLQAAMVYLPALWAMLGLCVFLAGAFPKAAPLAWAAYAFSFFLLFSARLFPIPKWVVRLSPFSSIPQLPVAEFDLLPLVILTLIGAALAAIGLIRFRQRDLSVS